MGTMDPDATMPRCRVCGMDLSPTDTVYCGQCGTPHHRDCWAWVGRCSIFACGSTVSVASLDRVVPPAVVAVGGSRQVRLAGTGKIVAGVLDVDGNEFDRASRQTRLDLDTPLELFFQYGALAAFGVGLAFASPKHGPANWSAAQVAWLVALGLLVLRMVVDCTYLLDNERREVLFARSIVGIETLWRVCSFDDIVCVGLTAGRYRDFPVPAWFYAVVMELPRGVRINVSTWTKDYARAVGFATELADHVGARLVQPQRDTSTIDGEGGTLPMADVADAVPDLPAPGRTNPWLAAFFAAMVVLNIAIILFGP